MAKTKLPKTTRNTEFVTDQNKEIFISENTKEKFKRSSRLHRWLVTTMLVIIVVLLGSLVLAIINSNSSPFLKETSSQGVNSSNNTNLTDNSSGNTTLIVGPPGHQVDLGYPSTSPVSMKGSDISTPDPTEIAQLPIPPVMGAFLTTADPAKLEAFYSPKLKAAGYKWDSIEVCFPDGETRCPNLRAFVADLNNCTGSQIASAAGPCLSTFQIRLWFVGANTTAEEFKVMNVPQSIMSQLIPGRTLVAYSASSNILERPNTSSATMAVTTAAVVPTPTRGSLPITPIPQSQKFVGPDNAFHVSQYDNYPVKQSTTGVSLVTTGEYKPVAFGSDGTFQFNWLISEEGVKTTLQARVVTPHNTAFITSKQFTDFGFIYLTSGDGQNRITVRLLNSFQVNGTLNTYFWNMEAQPLPVGTKNYTLTIMPYSDNVLAITTQLSLKTFAEAGLQHSVNLQSQTPGGQAKGLWLTPQQAYFGTDRTILSLAFQPDVFRDKEAYWLIPQFLSPAALKVTDDKGRTLALLDPSQPLNLSSLVFGPVASDAKSLKVELGNMIVGHNLNQPTTSLENAPLTHLAVPVAELLKLKNGQTVPGPTLQTPGIQKLSIEAMSAKLNDSGEYVTLTVRYLATSSLAYPPSLIARSVGFSCEKCGQENMEKPVSSRMLADGSIEFNLTYQYDATQISADLKVDSEQFVLPGPWQFEVKISV